MGLFMFCVFFLEDFLLLRCDTMECDKCTGGGGGVILDRILLNFF